MNPTKQEPGHPEARPTNDRIGRRSLLRSSCAAACPVAVSMVGQAALASPAGTSPAKVGRPVRVSKEQLDALAAKSYALFNEGNVLGSFSPARHTRATTWS